MRISCDEFNTFSDTCDLIHMDTDGAKFTWTNRRHGRCRIDIYLDRALCNTAWYSIWIDTTCKSPAREFYVHHPLLLHFDIYSRRFPKLFRFMSCWLQRDSLLDVVSKNWSYHMYAVHNPMIRMMFKLKRLKIRLKASN